MKSLKFDFADARFAQMIEGNAEALGYQLRVTNRLAFIADPDTPENPHTLPNPESKREFVHRLMMAQLVDTAASIKATKNAELVRKDDMAKFQKEMHEPAT